MPDTSYRLPRLSWTLALGSLACILAWAAPAPAQPPSKRPAAESTAPTYAGRADAMALADEIAQRHGLDATWVRGHLAQARVLAAVQRLIMPPAAGTAKDWAAYRTRFIEPQRVRRGAEFWREHAAWLRKAEALYGVPAEVVVGIIGVETLYGRHMGGFRALDALATLSLDFPPGRRDRSAFFREELAQLFVLAASEGLDPASLRGSYAGALGMPQFMPSSWNRYAVDFDGDGRVDLHGSVPDVIGSVAHYLAEFGWTPGLPTHFEVRAPVDTAQRAELLAPDIVPSFTAQEFLDRQAWLPEAALGHAGLLALVELQNGAAAPSYVAGTSNFYAITRYNWSSYYAMAVIELGSAVAQAVQAQAPVRQVSAGRPD
ncbi:MAG: lytic murein transglycosylase B [Caldimonas sp.]|uniref:lytic murein transglycosylase B n=1 Tax=Caldimonas sp. TaxID=2838790 RepID=UPI00391D8A33